MTLNNRIDNLLKLKESILNDENLSTVIEQAYAKNNWFVPSFCRLAIQAITEDFLSEEKLRSFCANYPKLKVFSSNKWVGIIMAGNLPLVGFHDFLCCYLAGCGCEIKLSSKDDILTNYIFSKLKEIDCDFPMQIVEKLQRYDAVIATGSNNTNRYFETYFKNYPKILRRSRTSVAILSGDETDTDFENLADDILLYFGFGCRNVATLFVPEGFDVRAIFPYLDKYQWMHHHTKYMNNYDYNRSILLLNKIPHLSNDFIMLRESSELFSSISMLHYQFYKSLEEMESMLVNQKDDLQVCVSNLKWNNIETISFGSSQRPQLSDFADNVDTINFLLDNL